MISSSPEAIRKEKIRLIASFTRSSRQPTLFYTLEKKRKEQIVTAKKSMLMETQTEFVVIPFFSLLF